MPVVAQERVEVMRLITEPPKRLTQNYAQTRFDIECGNGPKVFRLARRVCTLHYAWADIIDRRRSRTLDTRLVQASLAVKTLIECHKSGLQIGCNIVRVEELHRKIFDRLFEIRNR
ncbi:hypothetical protein KDA14_04225 [Candidatus Saccharibacteria bacterium]|nr:hypothetical protein [Candidatus Saccharibacteria bacterium]